MSLLEAIDGLSHPWVFMGEALYCLPPTLVRLLYDRQWRTLASLQGVRDAWFGRFWARVGAQVRQRAEAIVVPLLHGLVRGGRVLAEGSAKPEEAVHGTVLEIGPGSGQWVSALGSLARRKTSDGTGITHIYGVEPNPDVHGALRAAITAAGLTDTYEIVPCGLESLASDGRVANGSIDSVVCVLCLCGVPEPATQARALYDILKPGGRVYVYEHVRIRSGFMGVYQALINLLWPSVMGGCQLRRDTTSLLHAAGPWTSFDVVPPEATRWFHTIPHVVGVLVK